MINWYYRLKCRYLKWRLNGIKRHNQEIDEIVKARREELRESEQELDDDENWVEIVR